MLTSSNLRKSIGSGELVQHAPNVSEYSVASHSDDQPPDEWPVTMRAEGCAISLNFASIAGINSWTTARPHGPLLSESAKSVWPLGLSGSRKIQKVLDATSAAGEPAGRCDRRCALKYAIV